MQSNNPVLSRPDAWQGTTTSSQYAQYPGQQCPDSYPGQPSDFGQVNPPVQAGRMTIDDVITKSAITMGTLMAVAALTFLFLPPALLMPAWIIGGLVSFGVVLLVSFRRQINPAFVLAYAAIEGVFIGAISKVFETLYSGIVPAAVMGTLVAAAVTLGGLQVLPDQGHQQVPQDGHDRHDRLRRRAVRELHHVVVRRQLPVRHRHQHGACCWRSPRSASASPCST